MTEERIEALEIRMTYLENYLNQINEIVLENGRLLEVIKKDQKSLRQQMNEVSNEIPGPQSAKPPHY
jgi:SlyX protein